MSELAVQDVMDWLVELGIPAELREQVAARPAPAWPPRPGCMNHIDYGPWIWAECPLGPWVQARPSAFGLTPLEIDAVDHISTILRRAGEGSRVFWGVAINCGRLLPMDVVNVGPFLAEAVRAEVDHVFEANLGEHCYGYPDPPNETIDYCGVSCYSTAWWYGVAPRAAQHGVR